MQTQLDGISNAAKQQPDFVSATPAASTESHVFTTNSVTDSTASHAHRLFQDTGFNGSATVTDGVWRGGRIGANRDTNADSAAQRKISDILGGFSLHKPGSEATAKDLVFRPGDSWSIEAFSPAPSVGFESFTRSPEYAKFQNGNCDFDQSILADGTKQISYTAKDFSNCRIERGDDGTCKLTVADSMGRPTITEAVTPAGEHSIMRLRYHDENGRFSPWLKSTEMVNSDGSSFIVQYDKTGKPV